MNKYYIQMLKGNPIWQHIEANYFKTEGDSYVFYKNSISNPREGFRSIGAYPVKHTIIYKTEEIKNEKL